MNIAFALQTTRPKDWVPSRAVVIRSDKEKDGQVLWYEGTGITWDVEAMSPHTGDLGLGKPPAGISIWEGDYTWVSEGWEHPDRGEFVAHGKFRRPTDAEWEAIREGRNPFPPRSAVSSGS